MHRTIHQMNTKYLLLGTIHQMNSSLNVEVDLLRRTFEVDLLRRTFEVDLLPRGRSAEAAGRWADGRWVDGRWALPLRREVRCSE